MKQFLNRKFFNLGLVVLVMVIAFISCTPDSNLRDGIREVTFRATANTALITEGESITYIDSSLNVASRTWTFNGADITTSDQKEVEVMYSEPSFDTVNPAEQSTGFFTTLEVEHDDGTTESNTFRVIVYPEVEAAFTADKTSALFGSTVQFTNLTKNRRSEFELEREEDSYLWEFEGGTPATSTAENPVVTYPEPGVYNVKLTAHRAAPEHDDIEVKTDYITILAAIPIEPKFSANITTIEAGEAITFTDSSSGDGDSWKWTFPGGTPETSTEQNPTVVYNEAGVYDVTLEVNRSQDGESESITKAEFITVTEATGPYCNDESNLVGCGNNDGEEQSLSDWVITGDGGEDRNANFSVSTERFSEGSGSLKYSYSEPGAPAFTDNFLRYKEVLVKVDEAGNYTLSMDVFGDISSSGTEFVFEISLVNAATDVEANKQFFRKAGGSWFTATTSVDLAPGDYYVMFKMWNPGFHADLDIDVYLDNITVVRN
ncbi:PKD domain-containing protein [Christiangramia forsetii]|uniref:Protein containing PKD domains n=2 Tax=Christiangramia forsetii TaxID=411153 RepID=A0M238_CHRFK|nr:PKD domain-containing protein [Christiangramia forsetii]GGG40175.1 hypothetical protein GCM10011532_24890 [Christiangramia forsetii]CAL66683.1 protein containing PKD domains [Christiangramia forsetii KT0803]